MHASIRRHPFTHLSISVCICPHPSKYISPSRGVTLCPSQVVHLTHIPVVRGAGLGVQGIGIQIMGLGFRV